jgi:Ulp1 family protease
MNRVQRVGAQSITGAFQTVSTVVAKAEASISTVKELHAIRAIKFWVNVRTLPATNPLSKLNTKTLRRYTSPLQKIAYDYRQAATDRMELIQPYIIVPWEQRLHVVVKSEETAKDAANAAHGIRTATCSSVRHGIVEWE